LAFENTLADLDQFISPLLFMQFVHQNKDIRQASLECEQKTQKLDVEVFTKVELYNALKEPAPRNTQEERLKTEHLKEFESNGVKLSEKKLKKFKKLQDRLNTLSSDFGFNIADDKSQI